MVGYGIHEMNTSVYPTFVRHLDDVGNGTGSHDMMVDGSGKPVFFRVLPPANGVYVISHLTFVMEQGGGWRTNTFGSGLPLANGVQVGIASVDSDSWIDEWTATHRIQRNLDFALYAHDIKLESWGGGDSYFTGRFEFRQNGSPILSATGDAGCLAVAIADDLTGFVKIEFVAEGYKRAG